MSLIDELEDLEQRAREMIEGAETTEKLEAARVALMGRKGEITGLMRMMGKIEPEERPVLGKRANEMRRMAETLLDGRMKDLKRAAVRELMATEAVDITLPGARPQIGHAHLINQIIEEIEDVFCGIGYTVEKGPQVESSWYNFTALNAPLDHPSRSARDTFYVKDTAPGTAVHPEEHAHGESDVLLRTQTSGGQIRTMDSQKPPIKVLIPGRVFRSDSDATHSPMFHQMEGLVVDKGITLGDLQGALNTFVQKMFGADTRTRLRPSYFPFTEPSVEVDVSCFECHGKGCPLCKHTGWIEVLGGGVVNRKVLENCSIDPDEYSGFAFGIGIERIAMLKYGINNIGLMFENNLQFLKQFHE